MGAFKSSYLQPQTETIGQEALAHIRKVHDKQKRISGEGLEAHSASGFEASLAIARGVVPKRSIEQQQCERVVPIQHQANTVGLALPSSHKISDTTLAGENLLGNRFLAPRKRNAEESALSLPATKKAKTDTLQMILGNQRSFQLLMVKQQHAMQENLLRALGHQSLHE